MTSQFDRRAERRMLTEMQIICNVCGIPLLTKTEAKIGVHVSCVQEVNIRPSLRIPSARYGTQHRPNLGNEDAQPVPATISQRRV